jgi:hypothetical protein
MELLRRIGLGWWLALGGIVLAFAATVLVLNSTVYSASGFVSTYLDALARHDTEGALDLAATGPTAAFGDADRVLLTRSGMGDLDDITIIEDEVDDAGIHHVVAEYVAGGIAGSTEFEVRRSGAEFGLFNGWAFADGPFAVVHVTVEHEREFSANGIELVAAQDVPEPYLVLVPSAIELSHDSEFYHADPVTVLADEPGAAVDAAVDIQATDAFVEAVQQAVNASLDACTTQPVLLPAGCPFGETIINRIVSQPVWSIVSYPAVTLVPDGAVATWQVPSTGGAAHLVVDVQSLFDGSISTFDEDVPFAVQYLVTVLPDGSPSVQVIPG